MPSFPTLSDTPDIDGWEEQRSFDPTIRARSEGGYVKTRPRTTRVPMQWKVRYGYLSVSDKASLQVFENSVKVGADAFTWINPVDGFLRTVRFKESVKYTPAGSRLRWRAEMILEEI
ncbi:MAG: hypothetical protein AAGU11_04085 [Syntrophobacteraceae bacterium]